MHYFNLCCWALLFFTEAFALKVEEVFFPIRNFSSDIIDFINNPVYGRPEFDLERVSYWDFNNDQEHNRRLLERRKKFENQTSFWDPEQNYHKLPLMTADINAILSSSGYKAKEHFVETDDGYNLTLHRIIRDDEEPSESTGNGVVFIQHGLLLSSDAYVLQNRKKNLVHTLVENNYDVWLGNARGNSYSRSHSIYNTNESAFWDFSFHEVGVQDLRHSIDYVLTKTKSRYLSFIGYSIGATESYVLISKYPEFNEKIRLLISISPLLFWERPDDDDTQIDEIIEKIENLGDNFDGGDSDDTRTDELYPLSSYMAYFAYHVRERCGETLSTIFGDLHIRIDTATCSLLMRHMPAGTSKKNLIHLLQLIKSGRFQEYDDGLGGEEYDLSKITLPHAVFVGPDEKFLYKKDINELQNRFPSSVIYKFKYPSGSYMNDLDYPFSEASKTIADAVKNLLPLY
ncbi:lipase A-like precursor [Nasonia vitripennis]|uniref:Partial AB-hydrolase lipase domain-containing protein n=1 Tax=Nasonia vitripennis TaxID=7425 RepID=A0A7M6UFQ4_NASVI|nr:lipase A-like precursor [Nasonia vitripennis]